MTAPMLPPNAVVVFLAYLDGDNAERFETLRHRMNHPSREALAEWLLVQGLQAVEDRLAAAAAADAEAVR